jgi:hypothetical protein
MNISSPIDRVTFGIQIFLENINRTSYLSFSQGFSKFPVCLSDLRVFMLISGKINLPIQG